MSAAVITRLSGGSSLVLQRMGLVLFYLTVVLAGAGIIGLRLPQPEGGLVLDTAELLIRTSPDQREDGQAPVQVTLPHSAAIPGVGRFWEGVYRFEFPGRAGGAEGGEPWAVLISNYACRVLVSLNGALLSDSRWHHTGLIANLTWTGIVPIPEALLREGLNKLEIREIATAGPVSYLGHVHVGPDRIFRPVAQGYHFLLVTLPQVLFSWQVGFALCLFMVWLLRRAERACLLFSAILLFSAANNLPLVLPEPLLSETTLRMTSLSFAWMTALLIPFVLSFIGRRPPPALAGLLALPVGVTAGFVILPPETFGLLIRYGAIPASMLLAVIFLAILLEAAIRGRHNAAHAMLGGALLGTCFGFHDWPVFYGAAENDHLFIARFGVPLFLIVISGVMMWRFAVALNVVDRFNAELRKEVAVAEGALRASLEREQEQERAIALESERSRLTRDLHDGLAGQLVSMVALSSRDTVTPGAFGLAARKALTDLRMVLASLAEVGDDLSMMLANFRDTVEPQLRALDVALDWRMSVLPEVSGWTSSMALELFRLLQEATISAARHSGADLVTVEVAPSGQGGVRVTVADCGRDGAADRPGGQGLANMRWRARAIGGTLAIESGPSGTRVVLNLPGRLSQPASIAGQSLPPRP